MKEYFKRASLLAICALIVLTCGRLVFGAGSPARPLITDAIDESYLVTLAGNTRPEANALNYRGAVADGFRMDHMFLQLRRPPEQENALEQYIDELNDPNSPNFHHWLTAQEIGRAYGLGAARHGHVTGWLRSHGFTVNVVYPNGVVIDFSGTAGQVPGPSTPKFFTST